MAIKDDLNVIKQELNAQEQFLENAIKTERFFKKYSKIFIIILVLIIAWAGYRYTSDYLNSKKLQTANKAYAALLLNPNDNEAKSILRADAPSLLAILEFKELSKNGDIEGIKKLANEKIDPLLAKIFLASIGEKSEGILADYNSALEAFAMLKEGEVKQADEIFAKIPTNSDLNNLIKNLKHYQDIK
ncbi:hypothetical protein [Campylobacter sp. 19-13652]|uniref:hypothetical protein n=1 Tax=Campylobacter sp. 19-13652 TaxID=2840180 RepID=UPI001C7803FF|nr:hypothetical protein [Campylobacter sp. 19-13652]BCX79774.1 hypothetical protein LBC_12360 [Campylobacter sp. 19-13652]